MARDIYHKIVKEALIKDGWTVTHDPLVLLPKAEGGLETDLGAEKLFAAEKDARKIAVEVKSFIQPSILTDFHRGMGQYLFYIPALEMKESDRAMFLAIPVGIYLKLVKKEVVRAAIAKYQIKILVYNPKTIIIESWKE